MRTPQVWVLPGWLKDIIARSMEGIMRLSLTSHSRCAVRQFSTPRRKRRNSNDPLFVRWLFADGIDTRTILRLAQKPVRSFALPTCLVPCETEMSRVLRVVSNGGRIGRSIIEKLSRVVKLCAEQHIVYDQARVVRRVKSVVEDTADRRG